MSASVELELEDRPAVIVERPAGARACQRGEDDRSYETIDRDDGDRQWWRAQIASFSLQATQPLRFTVVVLGLINHVNVAIQSYSTRKEAV